MCAIPVFALAPHFCPSASTKRLSACCTELGLSATTPRVEIGPDRDGACLPTASRASAAVNTCAVPYKRKISIQSAPTATALQGRGFVSFFLLHFGRQLHAVRSIIFAADQTGAPYVRTQGHRSDLGKPESHVRSPRGVSRDPAAAPDPARRARRGVVWAALAGPLAGAGGTGPADTRSASRRRRRERRPPQSTSTSVSVPSHSSPLVGGVAGIRHRPAQRHLPASLAGEVLSGNAVGRSVRRFCLSGVRV